MSLKGPDGTKVCWLCDRPWVIHPQEEKEDCWSVTCMIKTFPEITITAMEVTSDDDQE